MIVVIGMTFGGIDFVIQDRLKTNAIGTTSEISVLCYAEHIPYETPTPAIFKRL